MTHVSEGRGKTDSGSLCPRNVHQTSHISSLFCNLPAMSRFAKYSYKLEKMGTLSIKLTVSAGCFKFRIFQRDITEHGCAEKIRRIQPL